MRNVTDDRCSTDQPSYKQSVGDFLLRRLHEVGLSHIFGVAGDFNLELLEQVESLDSLWGAIGYTLPATFGSLLAAPERRHILFIGDGSFQLTGQELSSILRHHLNPVIFLLNNDGYTIERLILGEKSSYNNVQPWRYAALCDVFSDAGEHESRRVGCIDELESALTECAVPQKCFFIEVILDRMDAPAQLKKLGHVYAKQDYGTAWVATQSLRHSTQAINRENT